MEKEIAGKILSCLRSSPKVPEEDETNAVISLSHSSCGLNNRISENNSSVTRMLNEDIFSFNVGYSFTQYLAQSVDNQHGINLNDFEEYNYNIMKSNHKKNSPR